MLADDDSCASGKSSDSGIATSAMTISTPAVIERLPRIGRHNGSPSARLPLILLIEPRLQRREVIEDRRRIHLLLSADRLQRLGPRTALPHRQHAGQPLARMFVLIDRAAIERFGIARGLTERAVELELEDVGEEIARVRHVRGYVILRARIEILLAARLRRRDALVLQPQRPPFLVVVLRFDLAGEDAPAPRVDDNAERQERDFL